MLVKARNAVAGYERETVPFLGLNRSDDVREGEFSEQKNMSDRRYPYLAPRLPRTKETYTEPTALFAWNGKEIWVEGGILHYDGKALLNVLDGPKQFAVVNTKLVVWPDKLTVDLETRNIQRMQIELESTGAATFTSNSLMMPIEYAAQTLVDKYYGKNIYVYTYASVAFDTSTKEWTVEGRQLSRLEDFENVVGRYYIPDATYSTGTDSFANVRPAYSLGGTPEEPKNEYGVYGKFRAYESPGADLGGVRFTWYNDIIRTDKLNAPFADAFRVGDVVSIEGSFCGYYDNAGIKLTGIDAETNTLFFQENTFRTGDAIYVAKSDLASEKKYFQYDDPSGTRKRYDAKKNIPVCAGDILVIDDTSLHILDESFSVVATHALTEVNSVGTGTDILTLTALSPQEVPVKVSRKFPALDYICEHENRLWGVSNADKTIYVSSLGDPNNFYDYTGEAGGWAVAVGSEGDFTGICSYGNAVLCWKERSLHKVLGSYPSNYQTAFYRFAGVREGASKSLVNVNETLFFLGPDGVYSFTGSKPALISRALGADVLADGVGGTDGRVYYLSARRGEEWELLTYDSHTGLWCRSDEVQAVDFCRVDDKLKFLAGDSVYTVGGGDEQVEWEAVLAPMYVERAQHNKLIFYVQIPKGAYIAADVRFDDGRWMQVGILNGGGVGVEHMPVPLRCCNKFEVRLRGKGDCCVMKMVREYRLRAQYG
ncbi:MAG: hypothetical protein IJA11_08765 [Oscillospiraceae bacterium]|nr:hypothetical protein [Oscillospiraceae bacterium]